jgi:hypothetical protein
VSALKKRELAVGNGREWSEKVKITPGRTSHIPTSCGSPDQGAGNGRANCYAMVVELVEHQLCNNRVIFCFTAPILIGYV